jgi:hypothetical protein
MEENTQAIPTMLDEVRGMRSDLTLDSIGRGGWRAISRR